MAIPGNTVKVVLTGHLGSLETFETGFWLAGVTLPGATGADAFASAIGIIVSSHAAALDTFLHSGDGWDECRCYFYTGPGPAAYIGRVGLTLTGSANVSPLPPQSAVVVTTLTGFAGRRNRGRIYVPCTDAALNGTSRLLSSTAVTTMINAWSAMFQAINAVTGNGLVSVVSQVATSAQAVNSVRSDLRVDIQRRRANKMPVGVPVSATV